MKAKNLRALFPRTVVLFSVPIAAYLFFAYTALGQQGPASDSSATVARPRRSPNGTAAPVEDPNQAKIPSKFNKKNGDLPADAPTFRADVLTVTVDTAVVDNKGHFIPGLRKDFFRVLEDGVPQKVSSFSLGEAPMTIALIVEFSNRFQQYYSAGWFQTLEATYGFVQTLKPEDYLAVIAYDLRTEILSDFTTDRSADQRSAGASPHSRLFRVESVRRGGGYGRTHGGHRRAQSHRTGFVRHGHFQQVDI